MPIVFTNRAPRFTPDDQPVGNALLFKEHMPFKQSDQVFLANATFQGTDLKSDFDDPDAWNCDFFGKASSAAAVQKLEQTLRHRLKVNPNVLVFVHGFDQSFPKTLRKATQLEEIYGVTVMLFTWPSQPPVLGKVLSNKFGRYITNKSRRRAKRSASALIQSLNLAQRTASAMQSISFSMLCHSMGNLALKHALLQGMSCPSFDHVMLHQAEVPAENHQTWVNRIQSKSTFITMNENDFALMVLGPFKSPRLGTKVAAPEANAFYLDLTKTKAVGNRHTIYLNSVKNETLKRCFDQIFKGQFPKGISKQQREILQIP